MVTYNNLVSQLGGVFFIVLFAAGSIFFAVNTVRSAIDKKKSFDGAALALSAAFLVITVFFSYCAVNYSSGPNRFEFDHEVAAANIEKKYDLVGVKVEDAWGDDREVTGIARHEEKVKYLYHEDEITHEPFLIKDATNKDQPVPSSLVKDKKDGTERN